MTAVIETTNAMINPFTLENTALVNIASGTVASSEAAFICLTCWRDERERQYNSLKRIF